MGSLAYMTAFPLFHDLLRRAGPWQSAGSVRKCRSPSKEASAMRAGKRAVRKEAYYEFLLQAASRPFLALAFVSGAGCLSHFRMR